MMGFSSRRSTQNKRRLQPSFKQFYAKYRELILFNKNIIIAAVASIIGDAIVVQYAVESISNDILASIFSIITDTGIYFAAFAGLFYVDNRNKYIDVTKVREIQLDLGKMQRE